MFTIEYAYEEVEKLDKLILRMQLKKNLDVHQLEYIDHLKRLRVAYEKELDKAKKRSPNTEIDALDHVRRYFFTDRSYV